MQGHKNPKIHTCDLLFDLIVDYKSNNDNNNKLFSLNLRDKVFIVI